MKTGPKTGKASGNRGRKLKTDAEGSQPVSKLKAKGSEKSPVSKLKSPKATGQCGKSKLAK